MLSAAKHLYSIVSETLRSRRTRSLRVTCSDFEKAIFIMSTDIRLIGNRVIMDEIWFKECLGKFVSFITLAPNGFEIALV